MIAKVSLPSDDSEDIIRKTIAERTKYKTFYQKIESDLLSSIRFYIQHQGNPEVITPLDLHSYTDSPFEAKRRKKSLIHLYNPLEGKLPYWQLEKIRKDNGLAACPHCGELGRPRTLDHYLPKDVFPEHSINLLNLIPMCDWCQGEKSTDYLTSDGFRRFIHPYFDDVDQPLIRFLFIGDYISPVIEIEVMDHLPVELQKLVVSHLSGIDFENRTKRYITERYSNILRHAKESRLPSGPGFGVAITWFLRMEESKSINSWDAILYRSIKEDPDLMYFLENANLPEHL